MNKWFKFAWAFSLSPLFVGVSIFLLWWLTRADGLVFFGICMLFVGVACVFITLACLVVAQVIERMREHSVRASAKFHTSAILAVIIANFVAAAVCIFSANAIMTRYRLSVTNDSDRAAKQVIVEGGGVHETYGDIMPDETITRSFWIQGDGELVLTAIYGEEQRDWLVDQYVTNGMGADVHFKINHADAPDSLDNE